MLIRTIAAVRPGLRSNRRIKHECAEPRQVEQRLSGQGFRVLEVERDDGEYEVKAFNAQGQCHGLHVNSRTGEIRRNASDDDCHEDGRSRRSDRR